MQRAKNEQRPDAVLYQRVPVIGLSRVCTKPDLSIVVPDKLSRTKQALKLVLGIQGAGASDV